MKKMVNYFFSKFAIFVLVSIYLISVIASFCVEYYIAGTDLSSTLFLRISTIVLDVIVVGGGIYTLTKRWMEKRFLRREIFRKNVSWVLYLAETLAIFLLFYIPYVARVVLLFLDEKITIKTLILDLGIGIGSVLFLGYWINRIIKRLKEMGKKLQDDYCKKQGLRLFLSLHIAAR